MGVHSSPLSLSSLGKNKMCRAGNFEKTLKFCNENWDKYLGDCNIINTFLKDKPKNHLLWSSLRFVNVYFRSLGQTIFVNNPFLGLLFLIGISLGNLKAGLGCAVGG